MRYLEVIFYNISYDIKNSLPDTRILYILAQTESFFLREIYHRISPQIPYNPLFSPSLQVFSFLPCILSILPVLALNTLEKASGSPYPTFAATSLT